MKVANIRKRKKVKVWGAREEEEEKFFRQWEEMRWKRKKEI